MNIKNICCIGAGYVGGPTMAVIANHNTSQFRTTEQKERACNSIWILVGLAVSMHTRLSIEDFGDFAHLAITISLSATQQPGQSATQHFSNSSQTTNQTSTASLYILKHLPQNSQATPLWGCYVNIAVLSRVAPV